MLESDLLTPQLDVNIVKGKLSDIISVWFVVVSGKDARGQIVESKQLRSQGAIPVRRMVVPL